MPRSAKALLSLSWQSIAYGLGIFGRQAVIYLTLPLLTAYLDREAFGVVSVTTSFLAFINMISNGGMPAATYRQYNDSPDPLHQRQVLGSSLLLFVVYALAIGGVSWLLSDRIALSLLGEQSYGSTVRLISALLFFFTLLNFGYMLLRIQVRPLASSLQYFLQAAMELGLALVFVIFYKMGAHGYWWGRFGGIVFALLVMVYLVRDTLTPEVSRVQMGGLIKYALPMIPATISLWALRLVDRALITSAAGLSEVAVYEIGYKIGMLTGMITIPFLAAWPQFSFSTMHEENASVVYRNVLTYVLAGSLFVGLGIITFSAELVYLIAPSDYGSATVVIPWIVFAQVAWAAYPVLSLGPKIKKKTVHLAWVTGVAALLNVGLNLLLIPAIGIQGAAVATFAAYVVLAILTYGVGQRYFKIPLDWKRLTKLAMASLLTLGMWMVLGLNAIRVGEQLPLRLACLLIYPASLVLLRFLNTRELLTLFHAGSEFVQKQFKAAI